MLKLDLQDLYGSWDDWNQGETSREEAFSPETRQALDAGVLVLGYREDGDQNQAIADAVRAVQPVGPPGAVTFVTLDPGFGDAVFVAAFDQTAIEIPDELD